MAEMSIFARSALACFVMNTLLCLLDLTFRMRASSALLVISKHSKTLNHTWLVYSCFFFFSNSDPAKGFYTPSSLRRSSKAWEPILSKPLELDVDYQMTSMSHVDNRPLLLLYFVLEGIDTSGSPGRLIHQFMTGFLPRPRLRFEEIRFSLGSDAEVRAFQKRMRDLVATFHG
jgi:hypothetical protein